MKRTPEEWNKVLLACGVDQHTADTWAQPFADVIGDDTFSKGEVELIEFLGQILHESNHLRDLTENMNYSAQRICEVWPARFKSVEFAQQFANKPEMLANFVYGGRMGNKDAGDGWKYRARTPIGITGRDNYDHVGDLMGQDLVGMPELLEQPHFALEACIHWWEDRIPDSMVGDVEKITKQVNGGLIGLADREQLTNQAAKALA